MGRYEADMEARMLTKLVLSLKYDLNQARARSQRPKRFDHEKKSDGVRVDHEKKSDGVRVHNERKSDGVRVHHKKERWAESSQ